MPAPYRKLAAQPTASTRSVDPAIDRTRDDGVVLHADAVKQLRDWVVIEAAIGDEASTAEHHLACLFRSLAEINIPNPHDREQWMTLIQGVIDVHPEDDQMVYIHVTRSVAKRAHAFPEELLMPTVFIMTNPLVLPHHTC